MIERVLNTFGLMTREAAQAMAEDYVSGAENYARSAWINGADAMQVAAVNRCVKLISEAVASMPLVLESAKAGVFRPMSGADLYGLLRYEPNPQTSAWDFWAQAVRSYLLNGLAVIIPRRRDGVNIDELILVDLRQGSVIYNPDKTYTVTDKAAGIAGETYHERQIIVVRNTRQGDTYTGFAGIGGCGRNAMKIANAGDAESYERIINGGVPRMLLTMDAVQTGAWATRGDQLDKMAARVDSLAKSGARAIALRGGIKGTQMGASSAELQLQTMREYTVREICRFFGVPPTFVYSDTSSNYKTADAAYTDFMANTIDPILRCFESEIGRKLLPLKKRETWRIRFDRTARNVSDPTTMANYFTKMLGVGYKVNEIRQTLGLAPVEGGDAAYISANLKPLESKQ